MKHYSMILVTILLVGCTGDVDVAVQASSVKNENVVGSPEFSVTLSSASITHDRNAILAFDCSVAGLQIFFSESSAAPVATSPGWNSCSPVMNWTLSAGDGSKTIYIWGKASNGQVSESPRTVAILLDQTPPSAPGSIDDGSLTSSVTITPAISWAASTDAGSGTSGYEIALGTSAGDTSIKTWTGVGSVLSATLSSGLSLTNGERVYVSVRAFDQAGNRSAGGSGDGFWVAAPSLSFDFTQGSLASSVGSFTLSLSRNSNATYFDEDGVMKTVSAHQPRFGYDPTTHQPKGLLVEESRTNRVAHSKNIGGWTAYGGTSEVTLDTHLAPDGTMTADTFRDADASGSVVWFSTATVGTADLYTGSVYLRKKTSASQPSRVVLWYLGTGTAQQSMVEINLVTGAHSASGLREGYGVESRGDYWYVWISARNNNTGNTGLRLTLTHAGGAGTVESTVAWGAQLEMGAFPTSFIHTNGASATRQADVVSLNQTTWLDPSVGSFVAFAERNSGHSSDATYPIFSVDDGTANNAIRFLWQNRSAGDYAEWSMFRSGAEQLSLSTANGSLTSAGSQAFALSYSSSGATARLNSGSALNDASVVPPTGLQNLRIGSSSGSVYLNGYIRQLNYYPASFASGLLGQLLNP